MSAKNAKAAALRRALAKTMFAESEVELKRTKQAAADSEDQVRKLKADLKENEEVRLELLSAKKVVAEAEGRVAELEDEVGRLEAALEEGEKTRLALLSKVEPLERANAALISKDFAKGSAERARADDLAKKIDRVRFDLDRAGHTANTAMANEAKARQEVQELGRKNDDLSQEVKRLKSDRAELRKSIASLNGRTEKAAQASAARTAKLQGELQASRSQVQAILAGIATARDNPGKE